MSKENRDRLALRMGPETKQRIDQWYKVAGCHSRNQFVEQAVNFYADHLAVQNNGSLPKAISSSLDGRLGMFEDRLSSLLYKHSVELDMVMGILADSYQFTEEDMERLNFTFFKSEESSWGLIIFLAVYQSDCGQ